MTERIYVIQVLQRLRRDERHPSFGERNIGWYPTYESALGSLHANRHVFAETMPDDNGIDRPYYPYALIEPVDPGPYACGDNEDCSVTFFQWQDGDYVEMSRPKELEGVVGFTMG